LLEKAYERILKAGRQQRGWSKRIFNWALDLAHRYELGHSPRGWYGLQLWIARWLVFAKWRAAFGGKLRYLICGGAALSPTIANVLSAASIPVLQGYGLTETSSVVCYNRDRWNRAGTVGVPIPGVDLQLAEDGEILVRSPYVMQGYYKDAAATQAAIDAGGWFHTGDLGELTPEGFLKIVGYKKNLFKLSTGRYVSPQPFERQLCQSPFVEWAIVVGAQRKFCSVLIVPHLETLSRWARERGLDCATERWLHQPQVKALYQALVDEANQCLPYGSRAKRFHLVDVTLAIAGENSELDVQQHRHSSEALTTAIEAIYAETEGQLPLHLFIPFSYLHLSYLHQLIAIRPH
jgi:long-chain acyl-CoA synthetase